MIHEILILLTAAPLLVSPHCNTYGPCRPPTSYLPAPPGHTPPCAKPGWTYCESIDHYPGELIHYLIDHWGYNYHHLISDESTQTFNYREPVTYGPPVIHRYYPNNRTHGYPPRRYKLPAHQQHILEDPAGFLTYSSLNQQTPPVTHYNPNQWWTRYRRSTVAHKKRRRRRQATPPPSASTADTITLCPTTRQFIMPKAAMNNQGNWMYVVNLSETDNRYTQLVGTETCASTQCNGLCSLPSGYTSRCEQQYVQKRLIALQSAGDRLYTDVFWFPHCCLCQINPGTTG